MAHDDEFIDMLRRIGRSLEIVGLIGGVLGLAIAAFSGPAVIGAVAAEVSIDIIMGASGVILDKFGHKMAPFLSRIGFGLKEKRAERRSNQQKSKTTGETVSKIALATSPLEFMTGFAIAGFSRPLAVAAVVVTALPCTVIALGGLVHDKIAKHKEKKATLDGSGPNFVRTDKVAEKPSVEFNGNVSRLSLKALRRNPQHRNRNII